MRARIIRPGSQRFDFAPVGRAAGNRGAVQVYRFTSLPTTLLQENHRMSPRSRVTHLFPLLCVSLFLVLPDAASAQTDKPGKPALMQAAASAEASSVAGDWSGFWASLDGYFYTAELSLEMTEDGGVQGQIVWTLDQSPRKEESAKLGLTGIEYVRGTFDPASGVLLMEGYEKDDPNTILGLDRYRLVISEDGMVIGGITWHHGDWKGLFMASAAE